MAVTYPKRGSSEQWTCKNLPFLSFLHHHLVDLFKIFVHFDNLFRSGGVILQQNLLLIRQFSEQFLSSRSIRKTAPDMDNEHLTVNQ